MNNKVAGLLSFINLAAALSASPANAIIVTPQAWQVGDYIEVSNDVESITPVIVCGIYFVYFQRMTIQGGSSMMIPTDQIYRSGRHALTSAYTCDGVNIYELDFH